MGRREGARQEDGQADGQGGREGRSPNVRGEKDGRGRRLQREEGLMGTAAYAYVLLLNQLPSANRKICEPLTIPIMLDMEAAGRQSSFTYVHANRGIVQY